MREQLIAVPSVTVADEEYRRLLGYPRGHEPSPRALELAAWARAWYAEHGQAWIYVREAAFEVTPDLLRFDATEFRSAQLREYLVRRRAHRAVYLAVSAGPACENQARQLWQESKPDEYFFLETYGSAVVERLVAMANSLVCAEAAETGCSALPHYSPGYNGWDVADQGALFERLVRGSRVSWPTPLEVLSSGMLRPKKSLLGVIGLGPSSERDAGPALAPCVQCSFSPCQYRRAAYRHSPPSARPTTSVTVSPTYSVNARALRKWAAERVWLDAQPEGRVLARFRFDGTTCSNMGRPLAFEYRVQLGSADEGHPIVAAECRPWPGDEGHRSMCEYLRDPDGLLAAIAAPPPVLGRPLAQALRWERTAVSTGCYCDADARLHKWGLALEAIHYALTNRDAFSTAPETVSTSA
jgi:hypothetical protein